MAATLADELERQQAAFLSSFYGRFCPAPPSSQREQYDFRWDGEASRKNARPHPTRDKVVRIALDDVAPYEEGCLSVPGFYEKVQRPARVRIKALDRDGNEFEEEADELLATCIQHEIDHLDGKLFVDYVSRLKRDRIKKKLEKIHRQQA